MSHLVTPAAAADRDDWSLDQWLAWQERLHPSRIDLGLERVRRVASCLGLLEAWVPTLTVAGTNGKGSTAVLAAAVYRAAGYRVGCYTSPHLRRYNERIAIDDVPVSDAQLCRAFAAVEQARGDVSLTYFEFGTLAALWLFQREAVQVQVLEVGLGGRLDAVNVVDADAAILTQTGLDHTDWLGPTRESIGREQAGVFREGRVAVCVDPDPPRSVLEAARTARAARLLGRDFSPHSIAGGWDWRGPGGTTPGLPLPALPGTMQLRNAAGVLAAVDALQQMLPVPRAAIETGLERMRLPGRLERRGDLLLDVAHNAEAVAVLASWLRAQAQPPRAIVIGMMRDKPVEAVARELLGLCERVYAVGLPAPRGLSGRELASRLAIGGLRAEVALDPAAGLCAARAAIGGNGTIVVCGSFKTVAGVVSG
ncbi:MAG TPA: bifunctional tetrahydrofolate synthase/dihydrofolate synthase [Nevskiaceae bacterium]